MTDPRQEQLQDLAAAYALDALTPEEASRFEAFLTTSADAQRDVAEFREVAALLGLAGSESAVGADLRARLLARIEQEKGVALPPKSPFRRTRASPAVWGALAASLIAVLGLGAGLLSLRGDVARLEQTLAERQRQLASREATLDAILEPGVELYQLSASGDPDPGIQLFWDRQRNRAIVHGFRLKPVPEGRAYQLWFIKDGKPVPSVTFKPEPDGNARLEQVAVPADGKLSAAAITIEPETGSQQPTSPILLVGSLEKSPPS
jgi:anti-sigma-K factor RskA